MYYKEEPPGNGKRFKGIRLALESLKPNELRFVVKMANLLRAMKNKGIVINHYSVNADKFVIIMEHHSDLKE